MDRDITNQNHIDHVLADYSSLAHEYDTRWDAYSQSIHNWVINHILHDAHPPSLLDVACGTGLILERIHAKLPSIDLCGMDINSDMLALAKTRLPQDNFVQNNVEKPWKNLPKAAYDCVLSLSVLHHLKDVDAHLKKLHAHCDENGTVYLADFALDSVKMKLAHLYWRLRHPSYVKAFTYAALTKRIEKTRLFRIEDSTVLAPTSFWRVQVYKLKPIVNE